MVKKLYGYHIIIDTDKYGPILYGHLTASSSALTSGQNVAANDQVGLLGSTGRSDGPHLHFMFGTEEPGADPNPLKLWTKISHDSIAEASKIFKPDFFNPYAFLLPDQNGQFPATINMRYSIDSNVQKGDGGALYQIRSVTYIDAQRNVADTPDKMVHLYEWVDHSIKLPDDPPIPGKTYTITTVLYDTEEMMHDNSSPDKQLNSVNAANDPIARADVDLYVPDVAIDSPVDGASYNQCDAPKIDVTGHVKNFPDATAALSINGAEQNASLSADGSFTNSGISLREGANTFFANATHPKGATVASKKVTVTYNKPNDCDPNDPNRPGGPNGPGGPSSPSSDPAGKICSSPCGVLGGWLNYLCGKLNSGSLLAFLNSGAKANPKPKCPNSPPKTPFSSGCGAYYKTMEYTYNSDGTSTGPVYGCVGPGYRHNDPAYDTPTHRYTGTGAIPYIGFVGIAWGTSSIPLQTISCNLLPPNIPVPDDVFAGTADLPSGDYISADGHLLRMTGGKAQDMGPDPKGRKPGFYPASGPACN